MKVEYLGICNGQARFRFKDYPLEGDRSELYRLFRECINANFEQIVKDKHESDNPESFDRVFSYESITTMLPPFSEKNSPPSYQKHLF